MSINKEENKQKYLFCYQVYRLLIPQCVDVFQLKENV